MARPKEFDRDAVLDRAMDLFWERGFEATSVGDLVDRLGIGRQSLYDTFGDKRALYLAALDRYRERFGVLVPDALAKDLPVRRLIRELLQGAIDASLASGRSCMLIDAAAERCPHDAEVKRRFCGNAARIEEAFAARLEESRRRGEIAAHHDPRALALYFVNALNGLQIMAKSTGDRRALEQVADVTVSILG
jgi:TetR/AcrR family transcriptional repressor of nem operon